MAAPLFPDLPSYSSSSVRDAAPALQLPHIHPPPTHSLRYPKQREHSAAQHKEVCYLLTRRLAPCWNAQKLGRAPHSVELCAAFCASRETWSHERHHRISHGSSFSLFHFRCHFVIKQRELPDVLSCPEAPSIIQKIIHCDEAFLVYLQATGREKTVTRLDRTSKLIPYIVLASWSLQACGKWTTDLV